MERTWNKKYWTIVSGATILIISVLIKISSFFPDVIERYYSRGIYPRISWFYRTIFGWIPISIGDIFYFIVGCLLLWRFFKFFKILLKGQVLEVNYARFFKRAFFILSAVYIYFNLSWGLNYNRPGIATQLGLNPEKHTEQDLKLITDILINRVNENRLRVSNGEIAYKHYNKVFTQAQEAYQSAALQFPFLSYNTASVKRSLYGRLGNFLGFLGYYNPFTGEAQLNLTMPRFLIPYVSCHEMAHQLGYANESEANFVGYLSALQSKDTLFHYSAYFDLFNYANHELYLRDSLTAKGNYKKLDTLVKQDVAELKDYWRKSNNAIEPVIKIFYDHYLKANQQENGVKSYNEVIGWLIAYYKKYGKI
jgi:hypothetical protein